MIKPLLFFWFYLGQVNLVKLPYCAHVSGGVQFDITREVTPEMVMEHSGVSLNVH